MTRDAATRVAKLLRSHERDIPRGRVRAGDVEVREGFFGPGYGVATPEATAAIGQPEMLPERLRRRAFD